MDATQRGGPWWLYRALGTLFSTLAIVALVRRAIVDKSFVAPLELIFDAYNTTTRVLLGWAEPYVGSAVAWIGSFFELRLALHPQWRDIVLILVISFVSSERSKEDASLAGTVASAISGVVAGLVAATFLFHRYPSGDALQGALVGVFAILFVIPAVMMLIGWFRLRKDRNSRRGQAAIREATYFFASFLGAVLFFAVDAGAKLLMG